MSPIHTYHQLQAGIKGATICFFMLSYVIIQEWTTTSLLNMLLNRVSKVFGFMCAGCEYD